MPYLRLWYLFFSFCDRYGGSMKDGIQAIIRQIDSDAALHGDEQFTRMQAVTDHEIHRENARIQTELEQRRDMLLSGNRHELRRRLERYNRRLNRELLAYRRQLLDRIFDKAVQKLRGISAEEYSDIFRAAIKDLSGSYTLYIGEHSLEKRSAEKLCAFVIEEVKKTQNDLEINICEEPITGKSGFLLKDSRVEHNYLFEDLIDDIKSEQSSLILKEVFEDV